MPPAAPPLPPAQGWCGWLPYLNKWLTLSASLGVALCCGLTYCFAIWSGENREICFVGVQRVRHT